jgi:transposase InsO family protein
VIFPWVAEQAAQYPITMQCRLLGVSRSSYYAWQTRQDRPPTARETRRRALTTAIVACFAAAKGRVGRRPMQQLLARDGMRCAPGTIHRIMTEQGLQAGRRRAGRRTTRRDPAARTAHIRNHCLDAAGHRCFVSHAPGTKAVGDITYLSTREGWHYLAVVLDLATRAVIGWALRPTLQTELVTAALTMAHQHGHLQPGAIFHSDRGSQYTSTAFQGVCADRGITQSMGAVGTCWDNAVAEAFFATLKSDLVAEGGTFATRREATAWVVTYIEGWYNRRRPHRHNQGRPPLVAWQEHHSRSLAVHPS